MILKMKEILYKYSRICRDLDEITENTGKTVAEYSASFSCDFFGQCRLPADKVKEELGAFVQKMTEYSSMIEDSTDKLIALVGELEDYIAECLDKKDKDRYDKAQMLLDKLRRDVPLCLAILENCFGEFSAKLNALLNLPGEIITVNAGLVQGEASVFTVRLKSYTEKITRSDG